MLVVPWRSGGRGGFVGVVGRVGIVADSDSEFVFDLGGSKVQLVVGVEVVGMVLVVYRSELVVGCNCNARTVQCIVSLAFLVVGAVAAGTESEDLAVSILVVVLVLAIFALFRLGKFASFVVAAAAVEIEVGTAAVLTEELRTSSHFHTQLFLSPDLVVLVSQLPSRVSYYRLPLLASAQQDS